MIADFHVFPELFKLGPSPVYTYGVLLATAYLLGLKLAMARARTRGLDPNRALDLGIASSSPPWSAPSCSW